MKKSLNFNTEVKHNIRYWKVVKRERSINIWCYRFRWKIDINLHFKICPTILLSSSNISLILGERLRVHRPTLDQQDFTYTSSHYGHGDWKISDLIPLCTVHFLKNFSPLDMYPNWVKFPRLGQNEPVILRYYTTIRYRKV